jgi:pimeloyl-ACP methyl ester carboxylesterase
LAAVVACLAAALVVATPFVHRLYHPAPTPQASRGSAAALPSTRPIDSIVFIVPGTYGNEGFWPNVIPGKATFASELLRGMNGQAEIYPCLWYAANDHRNREAAAKQLAAVIDDTGAKFKKVYLVGHSHGGNVALLAAGMAKHPIAAVVCLSTPHVYLVTRDTAGKALELPVYCTAESRANVKKIIATCADADNVPDVWADAVNGIDDNTAIAMTAGWQEQKNHPRLQKDSFWAHVFGDGNVQVGRLLTEADANVTIRSFVADRLGIAPHYAAHSRRMGFVVGSMLADGCSPTSVDYLRTLIQPENSDAGSPIDEDSQLNWDAQNKANLTLAGWRLDHAAIQLDPEAKKAARNSAGSVPEPYLRIQKADHSILYESETHGRRMSMDFDSNFILWRGPSYLVSVYAQHNLKHDTTLGDHSLDADETPPGEWSIDLADHVYWSGKFDWAPVHY